MAVQQLHLHGLHSVGDTGELIRHWGRGQITSRAENSAIIRSALIPSSQPGIVPVNRRMVAEATIENNGAAIQDSGQMVGQPYITPE